MGKNMTGLKNFAKWTLQLTAILAFAASCTKSREAKFAYGTGENLLKIQDFDGKEFDLRTEDEVAAISSTKSAAVSSNSNTVKSYSLVKYKTDAELMDNSPLLGKKNFTYKIRYELTDSYLKVYKIASKKDLSLNEQTYAVEDSNGNFKVPLLGYPITGYYQVTRDRNDLDEQTSRLVEKSQQTKETATHFKINKQGKELFKAIQKIDTFPAKFFDGDWYYGETISANNYVNQSGYGAIISQDLMGNEASKVRLKKTENGLVFYNLNIDDKLKTDLNARDENKVAVVTIPARWKQYKQAARGRDTDLSETEDNSVVWNARDYVEIDLSAASSALAEAGNYEIRDMQIDDNYFSFTTISKANNMKIRHSFLKATERSYKPKNYFVEDQVIFGLFHSRKNELSNSVDRYYQKDFAKQDFVNRYNPEADEIVFHLSDISPEWVKPVAVEAVKQWNDAFKKAGIKTKVSFNDERVQLGDLRYNIINLVSQPDDAFSWGGFGPSLDDPQTGERISSTANVNVNDTTNFLIRIMRNMTDAQIGMLDKRYIFGTEANPSFELFQQAADGSTKTSLNYARSPKLSAALEQSGENIGLKLYEFDKTAKNGFKVRTFEKSNAKRGLKFKPEEDFGGSYGNIVADILDEKNGCPEVKKYIDGLKSVSQKASPEDELKLFSQCAQKISGPHLMGVLLHEMGHNFGLRHNFYGSVDIVNFIDKEVRTSSVMEYTTSNEGRGGIGPYDIAAMRWAYTSQVETKSGSIVKVSETKPIDQSLAEQNVSARKFMYCTDEDVDVIAADPMCARVDAGITPLEVVKNYINDYNTNIALGNSRRDRQDIGSAMSLSDARLERFLLPIKKFHDYFRFQVGLYAGNGQEYLENYDQDTYNALLIKMSKDPKFGPIFNQYYPASQLAYDFFKQIAFLPDQYCLTERELPAALQTEKLKVSFKLYNLSSIKKEIFEKQEVNVQSCKDQAVLTYLKDRKSKLIAQGGYAVDDQYNNLELTKSLDIRNTARHYQVQYKPDTIGMMYERANAMLLLTGRFASSIYNQKMNFYPNFLDNPVYRAELEDHVINRLSQGVDINSLKFLGAEMNQQVYSSNFLNEKSLLNFMFGTFKQSLMIPGKSKINNDRLSRFAIHYAYSDEMLESYEKAGMKIQKTEVLGQKYYATEKNDISFKLLKALSNINELKSTALPSENTASFIVKNIEEGLTSAANLSQYKIENFVALLETIQQVEMQIKKQTNPEPGLNLLKLSTQDIKVLGYYITMNLQKLAEAKADEAKVKEFTSKTMADFIKATNERLTKLNAQKAEGEQKYTLMNSETLLAANFTKKVKEAISISKAVYQTYLVDSEELDAQADILSTSVLER